ncbi:hypothetical protein NN484_21000 [Pseudomonas serboccidentalis]|uniref:Phospholipase C/D domain-containing protein n=1 Tax=Pseudomonas serboccidentalis TaxID=2964670 RepID=A0ABY7Z5U9_9PSED|nr:hypothetical protein [Pseudomonas serboccidentalis]WDR34965.1 hypothetical protein NN484_21000 [Pseudomonas serboccidentalis]
MKTRPRFSLAALLFLVAPICPAADSPTFNAPHMDVPTAEILRKHFAVPAHLIPLYQMGGHFYTVSYIAELAGVERSRADRLTCFSQAPDAINTYNAIPVSIKNTFYDRTWRHQIVNSLHSLHGGDSQAVAARRSSLQRLVAASYATGTTSDWKTGFLIHALGDSYAHVYGPLEAPHAYPEAYGHLFALFQSPDDVYAGENYRTFDVYIHALFDTLKDAQHAAERSKVDDLASIIKNHAGLGNKQDYRLISLMIRLTHAPISESDCTRINAELNEADVRTFLAELTRELKAP